MGAAAGTAPPFNIDREIVEHSNAVIFDRNELDSCAMEVKHVVTQDRSLLGALRFAVSSGKSHGASTELLELAKNISRVGKYRLEPTVLSRSSTLPVGGQSQTPGTGEWLGYDGENLAAVLYQLAETNTQALDVIVGSVKEVFPTFDGFDFNVTGAGRVGFSARFTHHPDPVVAPSLSHGLLLFIGLMTLLQSPTRPDICALEEPENGLDAKAIRAFYQKLVQTVGSNPQQTDKQILLSSHSPYVLVEAWNGNARDFVYHVTESGGRSRVTLVKDDLKDYGGAIQSDGSISIRLAERIMSERWVAQTP